MIRALTVALALIASPAVAQDRPTVATVNYPLAYFAERLGGEDVTVVFNVPADRDPGFWRPGLDQIAAIQSADVIALNGASFAEWTAKVSLPRSALVDTSKGFADAYIAIESVTHSHGADGEHSHTGTASYTWLDFAQAGQQAEALATAMSRRIPDLEGLDDRLDALSADLTDLDQRAREVGQALSGQTIIATHPRYQYFARAYGLDIASLEWDAGAVPTEAQWSDLQTLAQDTGAAVLIWEAAPPAEVLSQAEGMGLRSVVFSPLANRPAAGDFITDVSQSLAGLAEAAGQ